MNCCQDPGPGRDELEARGVGEKKDYGRMGSRVKTMKGLRPFSPASVNDSLQFACSRSVCCFARVFFIVCVLCCFTKRFLHYIFYLQSIMMVSRS